MKLFKADSARVGIFINSYRVLARVNNVPKPVILVIEQLCFGTTSIFLSLVQTLGRGRLLGLRKFLRVPSEGVGYHNHHQQQLCWIVNGFANTAFGKFNY